MPFLQAYAQSGQVDPLAEVASTASADTYFAQQACKILAAMSGLSAETVKTVNSLYCLE
jgi:hypothetical protein